jgi:hypothetical protein
LSGRGGQRRAKQTASVMVDLFRTIDLGHGTPPDLILLSGSIIGPQRVVCRMSL